MRVFQTKAYITITGEVPCDSAIDYWLHTRAFGLDKLVAHSRRYEHAYLAWETVRNARNPFFVMGTGFEGYLINTCPSADAALEKLIQMGHKMLESNCRLYRFDYSFKSRLMETIFGERSDHDTIKAWAALLGATLGRLRINTCRNIEAAEYQQQTYQLIKYLPPIHYKEHDYAIEQEYTILPGENRPKSRARINLNELKPCDHDAGRVIWSVGRFGHPLIREFLRVETLPHPEGYGS